MNIKRVVSAQVLLFVYLTSDSLLNFFVRVLLWGVVLLIIFKERAASQVEKIQQKLIKAQEKIITRINGFLHDLSIARIIKTLLLLKFVLFLTWLLPGWMFFVVLVEGWAFKEQIKPLREQLKGQIKQLAKTVENTVSDVVKQIPRYPRTTL